MNMRALWLGAILWLIVMPIAAQTSLGTGQLCVRAFEDRNGNGQEDPREPRITRALNLTLRNDAGVVIDSGFMEESADAANGTFCFQRLPAGQYAVAVSSAVYLPISQNEFLTVVQENTAPQVFPYPAQLRPVVVETGNDANQPDFTLTPAEREALLRRLLIAGIGSAIVIGAMAVVGALIAFVYFRGGRRRRGRQRLEPTQQYRPINPQDSVPMKPIAVQTPPADVQSIPAQAPALFQPRKLDLVRPDNFIEEFMTKPVAQDPPASRFQRPDEDDGDAR